MSTNVLQARDCVFILRCVIIPVTCWEQYHNSHHVTEEASDSGEGTRKPPSRRGSRVGVRSAWLQNPSPRPRLPPRESTQAAFQRRQLGKLQEEDVLDGGNSLGSRVHFPVDRPPRARSLGPTVPGIMS